MNGWLDNTLKQIYEENRDIDEFLYITMTDMDIAGWLLDHLLFKI